jgi:hypothetical protein
MFTIEQMVSYIAGTVVFCACTWLCIKMLDRNYWDAPKSTGS